MIKYELDIEKKLSLVSIIVPVYNVCAYIDKCVDSLVSQTYKNIEIVLVDDGSTDGSSKKCDGWAEKDSRVKVIHKENGGVSSARNTGLDNATGEYIMWADPDDYCENTFVQEMYKSIAENESELTLCSYTLEYANQKTTYNTPFETGIYAIEDIFNALFFEANNDNNSNIFTALWMGIFRRDIIVNNRIRFDENVSCCEDFLFYAEYIKFCSKISILNKALYYYVQRGSSTVYMNSWSKNKSKVDERIYVYKCFYDIVKANNIVDESLYLNHLRKKYAINCLSYIINLYRFDKGERLAEAYDFLKYIISKTEIVNVLRELDLSLLSLRYKITARAVVTGNNIIIVSWLIVYSILRKIRSFVQQQRFVQ